MIWQYVVTWVVAMILGGALSHVGYRQGRRHGIEAERRRRRWDAVDRAIADRRWDDVIKLLGET